MMMNRPTPPDARPDNRPEGQPAAGGPPRQMRATPPTPPRRLGELSGPVPAMRRAAPEPGPRYGQGDGRRMVVARDITLTGQISKCDYLIVEGIVESMRYDGQTLEVTESGSFNGQIEVETAEIAGIYDGTMIVRGRLIVRPTGRLSGNISYGELEVNAGGQVNGELKMIQNVPTRRGPLTRSSEDDLDNVGVGDDPAKGAAE